MTRKTLTLSAAALLLAAPLSLMACEYKAGETEFLDYATCRFGEDAIVVVDLPKGNAWDQCVYRLQAFRPEELLAVTKVRNGKEEHSINDRHQIGNPCYMTKQTCDAALRVHKAGAG